MNFLDLKDFLTFIQLFAGANFVFILGGFYKSLLTLIHDKSYEDNADAIANKFKVLLQPDSLNELQDEQKKMFTQNVTVSLSDFERERQVYDAELKGIASSTEGDKNAFFFTSLYCIVDILAICGMDVFGIVLSEEYLWLCNVIFPILIVSTAFSERVNCFIAKFRWWISLGLLSLPALAAYTLDGMRLWSWYTYIMSIITPVLPFAACFISLQYRRHKLKKSIDVALNSYNKITIEFDNEKNILKKYHNNKEIVGSLSFN